PRRPANHPRMQGRIGTNAPPATHTQTRPTHGQDAVFQVENHREVDRGAARNMARLMSVSLTVPAVVDRRKTVTRRLGWKFLRPGDRLTLCRKVMGRKPGEPLDRLDRKSVVSVVREPLLWIKLRPGDVRSEERRVGKERTTLRSTQ